MTKSYQLKCYCHLFWVYRPSITSQFFPKNEQFLIFPQFLGFEETISFIRINAAGDMIAVGCLDETIKVYSNAANSKMTKVTDIKCEGGEITALSFHKKGNVLLGGFKDGSLHMWALPSGKEMSVFYGHIDEISDAQFSRGGKKKIQKK